ncbi:hypothetical protein CEUSTIGMA_g5794.t1 [Chlamydomonas eustigma]|uniref:Flagellar associated protein n=1 Tax=Chlamydomonas eustigma TaxID=1157962 RepID=A0A250X620_9CHLO|nr:hypothetical protein CEUSTIGMA_g5794.t1 [Chlamydomonas eustigma]|eukprot:GAX78352.1 hypothetical protein CEUSTIGMA_g5794.t1 [Chlamydomonas eustigma]
MAIGESSFGFGMKPDQSAQPKAFGRSMMGKQADSKKTSAPVYSFNKLAERDKCSNLFLSSAHVDVERRCTESPGAIYAVPSSLDVQVDKLSAPKFSFPRTERMKLTPGDVPGPGTYKSLKAMGQQPVSLRVTSPTHRFGLNTREKSERLFLSADHVRENKGRSGTDPGVYAPLPAMGSQPLSSRRNMPSYSWGKEDTLRQSYLKAADELPPVGRYETWHAMGKQPLSNFKTLPAFGFGSSSFDKESKRFLTLGHTKEWKGSVSPNNYEHQTFENLSAFGKQPLSSRALSPSHKFGIEARMKFKVSDTPGPGSYD